MSIHVFVNFLFVFLIYWISIGISIMLYRFNLLNMGLKKQIHDIIDIDVFDYGLFQCINNICGK